MTTAIELINSALRLSNVIDENETASAEQGVQGLQSLNDLMGQWDRDGIRLGWSTVAELDDDVPIDPQDRRAVRFNFAVELSGEYGLEPSAWVAKTANETYAALAKAHALIVESSLDSLPREQGYYADGGAIETGG
jgi:hypothetical protein